VGHRTDPPLRDLFEEEAADALDAIEVLLPRMAERDAVEDLYGRAHVLKGSAAVMGIAPAAAVAAALSEVFEAMLRRDGAAPDGLDQPLRAAVADLRYLISGLLHGLDVGGVAIDAEQSLRAIRRSVLAGGDAGTGSCERCTRLEQRIAQLEARLEAGR
jgi:chemotaxis protein histidine kinase CheA